MMRALPYILLGVFGAIAIVLYIAGCAITKNWWLLFTIFPAIITCVLAFILMPMLDDSYSQEGCAVFTPDSTMFYLMCAIVSTIGLPVVFYNCDIINATCFGMHMGGDAVIIIGFIAFMVISSKSESSY